MTPILSSLNEEQRKAAEQIDGIQLILAGAGSGKTRTVTHKIAHMISTGIRPDQILAITFTNKAAAEMRERICSLVHGSAGRAVTAKTFHSFCCQILRKEYASVGLKRFFSIYDDADQKRAIKEVLENHEETEIEARELKDFISNAKNKMEMPEDCGASEQAALYTEYQQLLMKNNAVDFDDLLIYANKALENKEALAFWQDRFRYIFVDEFQDTNKPQFELVRALSGRYRNLCVVGDDNQSIYGWRGSDVQYIIDFKQWYPSVTTFRLETNYRSTPTIIEAASCVIDLNDNKTDKKLVAHRSENGFLVKEFETYNEYEEAEIVAQEIQKLNSKYAYADFAVLYRTNAQSRVIEDALRNLMIPYHIVGGINFYGRKEVKDIISFLRILLNPYDSLSLERVINFPPRKIGKKSIENMKKLAVSSGASLWDICTSSVDKNLMHFVDVLREAKRIPAIGDKVQHIIEQFKIVEYWQEHSGTNTATDKAANVLEFLNIARNYDESPNLEDFLEFLQLVSDTDEEVKGVNLMTAHASKGLEFPVVFVIGVAENLFPLPTYDVSTLEEERRLFYVALTRAKDIAYLSFPRMRYVYGEQKFYTRSHFIRAIPPKYIQPI